MSSASHVPVFTISSSLEVKFLSFLNLNDSFALKTSLMSFKEILGVVVSNIVQFPDFGGFKME